MEPLFFKAENVDALRKRQTVALVASMEPLFFKAENRRLGCGHAHRARSRFNGAAFFQSGKRPGVAVSVAVGYASMEPLFFKAENNANRTGPPTDRRLQWSRFFSKRKTSVASARHDSPGATLQWSRFFSKRKTSVASARHDSPGATLQWSRFFSKRKTMASGEILYFDLFSFNGAAFFQSGKQPGQMVHNVGVVASMEPLFFKAENTLRKIPDSVPYPLQWSRFFSKRKT